MNLSLDLSMYGVVRVVCGVVCVVYCGAVSMVYGGVVCVSDKY